MTKLDNFNKIIMGGKEIDKIYTGGSLIWKSNVEYERYNSLLEYTWRQYNTTLQYTWRKYNLKTVKQGSGNWMDYGNWSTNRETAEEFRKTQLGYYDDPNKETRLHYDPETGRYQPQYRNLVDVQVKGTYRGTVTSTSSTAYPTNGKSGSYWYDTRTSDRLKNTYRGTVTSTSSTAYPTNGSQGTYWYDTRTSKYIKGSYIDIVEAEEGTLPNGGRHTDGYWYVLKG